MATSRKRLAELTDLQLSLLAVFWERGEATAREVHAAIEPVSGLARGTVGTLLHRLERQGILTHRRDARDWFYRPTVTREQVQAARVAGLVGGLFDGSVAAMVRFAVSRGEVDDGDLAQIRDLLAGAEDGQGGVERDAAPVSEEAKPRPGSRGEPRR